jgi:hypothetical protein
MQFKIKLQNAGSVGLHIYRQWTIPDCPNKLFYTNQGEEEIWAVLGRDGQLVSEQETLLYLEVMMMMMMILIHLLAHAVSNMDCEICEAKSAATGCM